MRQSLMTIILQVGVIGAWYFGLFIAPVDVNQGEVYRILYLHVPVAVSAFTCAFIIFGAALVTLWKRSESALQWQRAAADIGLVFTLATLATGMIWGRPTWGVYWIWDARLTTTAILGLLYAGFVLLHTSSEAGHQRRVACSVLGILIFVDVPVIYKSVDWWRTVHQGHSLLEPNKSPMSPEIRNILVFGILMMAVYAIHLVKLRRQHLAKLSLWDEHIASRVVINMDDRRK